ncbi:MAG: DUF4783 domain-containing protein [Chitinophagia bacterium]|nr:DUF4783 domain-containing protein [Chitinophagia bacterium]
MSRIAFVCLLALGSWSFSLQNDLEALLSALKNAQADEVATYFDAMVDMKFPDRDEIKNVGKNQAAIALSSFYSEQKINGFEKISEREIGNTMYMTGRLLNGGKGFNITLMMKMIKGKHYIITVRIN